MSFSDEREKDKRFITIWISFAAIMLGIILTCTIVMNYNAVVMDLMYGKGAKKIINTTMSAGWDTNYYETKYTRSQDALMAGVAMTESIASEGQVLLKNSGILPLSRGADVTPFGYNFVFPNYGPKMGSAKSDFTKAQTVTPEAALESRFSVNKGVKDIIKAAKPIGLTATGYYENPPENKLSSMAVIEYNPAIYKGTESSCLNTVGIVFLGRQGGEGGRSDIVTEPLFDGTPHGVALSKYELETLKFAKVNCKKVVVIISSSNPLEIPMLIKSGGEMEADAIILTGNAGSSGFAATAKILSGEVCPSGKLPDIFASDYTKNPVFNNFGSKSSYTNIEKDLNFYINNTFLEYEEGIYNGYRYYETAAVADSGFKYGRLDSKGASVEEGEVCYPFGYGLSYSIFSKSIVDFLYKNDKVELKVKVLNNGARAGKEVVQIYFSAPYTELSQQYKIEKAAAVLVAYVKTKELVPGEEQILTISFSAQDMASYCYTRHNGDGTAGCYVLESGNYEITLRDNSHDVISLKTVNIPETRWYDGTNPRQSEIDSQSVWDESGNPLNICAKRAIDSGAKFVAATNKFQYLSDYMSINTKQLSRANRLNTQPQAPINFIAPNSVIEDVMNNKTFNPNTDPLLGDVENSKVYNNKDVVEKQQKKLTAADMRGRDFYDPLWEDLLDQLDYSSVQINELLFLGYKQTSEITSIGMPETQVRDSPIGITPNFADSTQDVTDHCSYGSATVMAATFNDALAYKYGEMIAQEAIVHNNGKLPISGWYAPAMNIHRGPFGMRQYEYFSEDPYLSGMIAAAICSGASDNGLFVTIKHFVANEQESERDGIMTWMNEQALREIYLKPFELCIKNSKTSIHYIKNADGMRGVRVIKAVRGLMTSKNSLGGVYCGASYALNTEVLRDEWNFNGSVISDIMYMSTRPDFFSKMCRSGNDVIMQFRNRVDASGMNSNTGKNITRESIRRICYMIVNSNVMQGAAPGAIVEYRMSPWAIMLVIAYIMLGLFIAAMTLLSVIKQKKKKNM